MVVTRSGSSSPSPKKGDFANLKGKERKKAIAIKSKVDTMDTQSVKRKQPEVASHIKKEKEKKIKLSSGEVSSGLEGPKPGRVSFSSSINVFHHLFCVFYFCILLF